MTWDVFVSHAFEDKKFARSLADALSQKGLRVWFDEFELRVGDSLRESIDKGLSSSRFGIVILSPNFFAKEWTRKELNGLVSRETLGKKIILPIWHNISIQEIRKHSPVLADRYAVKSETGLQKVLDEIMGAVKPGRKAEVRKRVKLLDILVTMSGDGIKQKRALRVKIPDNLGVDELPLVLTKKLKGAFPRSFPAEPSGYLMTTPPHRNEKMILEGDTINVEIKDGLIRIDINE